MSRFFYIFRILFLRKCRIIDLPIIEFIKMINPTFRILRFPVSVVIIGLYIMMSQVALPVRAQEMNDNGASLEARFSRPPANLRPYAWWHWMGSNFSKEGITRDLEAMKASGLGGATIFNIASAVQESHAPIERNPWPHQTYRSPAYWDAIRHAAAEADRLGLEIGLHNTAGYSTTGGPWVTEERGMQHLVWSKDTVDGGKRLSLILKKPVLPGYDGWGNTGRKPLYYQDIAALAVKMPESGMPVVSRNEIVDVTARMEASGRINWQAPAGRWVIYRLGHAPTLSNPHPLPDDIIGRTLEVDKLDSVQTRFHWKTVLDPLKRELGVYLGRSFKHVLIDSYEAGDQDWTPRMRRAFIDRKGYDPLPWLLSFDRVNDSTNLLVEGRDETARFKRDFRDVVDALFFEQGWEPALREIHNRGLKLQFEPYWGPFDVSRGAALADLPMGEFWTHSPGTLHPVTAAARAAGKRVVGAEAFTGAPGNSQYTEDPAALRPSANRAFIAGINRMILHTWVHQPFDDRYQPGMSMGWWGTHFGRHQTWFEPGKAFFEWMARTQTMLQFGEQVSDYLCLGPADSDQADAVSTYDFMHGNVRVQDGRIILPSGRSYPFLKLPAEDWMEPSVLERIASLMDQGLRVAGRLPKKAPGLSGQPAADARVAALRERMARHVRWYPDVEAAKRSVEFRPDARVERADSNRAVRWVHRIGGGTDLFFVANLSNKDQDITISFDIDDRQPELWDAESGRIVDASVWSVVQRRTHVRLVLTGEQSIFVVFRRPITSAPLAHTMEVRSGEGVPDVISLPAGAYLSADRAMEIELKRPDGKIHMISLPAAEMVPITAPWQVEFRPKLSESFRREIPVLMDFRRSPDSLLRYFSGTAVYAARFEWKDDPKAGATQALLDMGELHDIVSVKLNGVDLGVLWHQPWRMDLSRALKQGENNLEISVTNNWANRLVGDARAPADFEWGADRGKLGRAMKAFPDWFLEGKPRPSEGRKGFLLWHYHRPDSPLQPAGLIGPVRLLRRSLHAF
jgi:alpha-L-rhamnosidase